MAAKMGNLSALCVLCVVFMGSQLASGRIHRLKLENDDRGQIDLSTFGFLKKGYLAVNLTDFSITPINKDDPSIGIDGQTYGFTLDKTVSTGISPYLETKQENCILKDNAIRNDNSVSVLFLRMDFKNKRLSIDRKGNDLKDLQITLLTAEEFSDLRRRRRSTDVFSDTYLLRSRVRRQAEAQAPPPANKDDKPPAAASKPADTLLADLDHFMPRKAIPSQPVAAKTVTTPSPAANPLPNNKTPAPAVKDESKDKTSTDNKTTEKKDNVSSKQTDNKTVKKPDDKKDTTTKSTQGSAATPAPVTAGEKDLKLVNDSIPMTYVNGRFSTYFLVAINSEQEEGLYNLFFHNCHNYLKQEVPTFVNMTVQITENNNGNYLSAGQMPLPMLYFSLSILYLLTGGYWFYVLRSSDSGTVFKIHYLMLVLVFVKAIALLFHSINFYFIQKEGHHEEAFAILYYITHLMKGALLFITIVLIGAGWAFVKHILSDRDKKIFIIVIPLQILANVAQIIIAETEEGQSQYTTWKEVFILVDLLCCGAILFPVVWSIRHLQEASGTDGKAAINLAKLKIFRHFYIMIVCYIYFTRIIVYLLKITVPFEYEWLDELFKELATFVFFVVTGYKFRPASNNPYLQVSTDSDDEIEMDEVVTKSGALDDVVRVNVKTKVGEEESVGPSKRESSHDYD